MHSHLERQGARSKRNLLELSLPRLEEALVILHETLAPSLAASERVVLTHANGVPVLLAPLPRPGDFGKNALLADLDQVEASKGCGFLFARQISAQRRVKLW